MGEFGSSDEERYMIDLKTELKEEAAKLDTDYEAKVARLEDVRERVDMIVFVFQKNTQNKLV